MSREDDLERLVDRWEELREQGQSATADELTDDPELARALKNRLAKLVRMDWLDEIEETVDLGTSPPITQEGISPLDSCVPWMFGNRYVLESLIAGGGFGQVWRAYDRRLERHVAVKVSKFDNTTEARHVAKLQHPGIVAVHDLGEEQGFWFIVFDLIDGVDLAKAIETDPPTWRQGVQILADVADLVDYAHQRGFVHRDIKPANILIKKDGRPVLADFGIAITETDMREETSTTAGTLAYMAPELLVGDGRRADACTDVYGLGVVLFQVLTRELPFVAKSFFQTRQRILSGELPRWPVTVEAIPDELQDITMRCLSKDPDMRYQSAGELARKLRALIGPPCQEMKA
jgi:serine/threonine-protein kinase